MNNQTEVLVELLNRDISNPDTKQFLMNFKTFKLLLSDLGVSQNLLSRKTRREKLGWGIYGVWGIVPIMVSKEVNDNFLIVKFKHGQDDSVLDLLDNERKTSTEILQRSLFNRQQDLLCHLESFPNLEFSGRASEDPCIYLYDEETKELLGRLILEDLDENDFPRIVYTIVCKDAAVLNKEVELHKKHTCKLWNDPANRLVGLTCFTCRKTFKLEGTEKNLKELRKFKALRRDLTQLKLHIEELKKIEKPKKTVGKIKVKKIDISKFRREEIIK